MGIFDNFGDSPVNPFYMWQRKDPQAEANKYLNRIPAVGEKYLNPFIQQGQTAGNILQSKYGDMTNDPQGFINKIMQGYSMSPGAQYQKDQLGRGINATAAAGGYAGTPEHETDYGTMIQKLMSGDMQQYLQNALGVEGTGLSGEENEYGNGFTASNSLADMLGGKLSSQAGLGFQSATNSNADRSALMNALIKALAGGAGASAGGGAAG